jgi:lysozyme
MWKEEAKAQIKKHEGISLTAYKDSLGFWTIGYGHYCGTVPPIASVIDKSEDERLFNEDFSEAVSDAMAIFASVWESLTDNRKIALTDMSFNLGGAKLRAFVKLIGAIRRGDFESAANEALSSRWAKQVGKRAIAIAEQLRKG